MAEPGWGDDLDTAVTAPPRRSRLPVWARTCGCGCLLAVAAAVLLVVLFGDDLTAYVEGLTDPETQWERIALAVPVDERPPYLEVQADIFSSALPGIDGWLLFDRQSGLKALLLASEHAQGRDILRRLLDPEARADPIPIERHEATRGTVVVAGRELDCLRFQLRAEDTEARARSFGGAPTFDARGAGLTVDLTPRSGQRALVLVLGRDWDREPIADLEVGGFLAPFRIEELR